MVVLTLHIPNMNNLAFSKFQGGEMVMEKGTHASWLHTCPCNDTNFKIHLTAASIDEIEYVLSILPETGNKTKIAVLKRELNKRRKGGTKCEQN